MWSNKYIGIPYKTRGRDNRGVDCWGLVRLIYSEQYGIGLPSLVDSYTEDDDQRIAELIDLYREGWEEQTVAQPGDVVLFRVMGEPTHVGIVIENNRFIHSILNKNVAVENLTSLSWSKRVVGYYRYKTETTSSVMNVAPHPLKTQRYTVPVPVGTTVAQIAEWVTKEYGISDQLKSITVILVNGRSIDKTLWDTVTIKDGDTIEYRAVAQKGNGLRLILTLAFAFAAPYMAAGLTSMAAGSTFMAGVSAYSAGGLAAAGGGLLSIQGTSMLTYAITRAAVGLVGTLLIDAIAPVRPPDQKTQEDAGKIYLSTGTQNRLLPYEPIPVVLGKVRMTPPLGAENVSRYQNETDTYLDILLVWGYGPLSIDNSSIRIGDNPITNYVTTVIDSNTGQEIPTPTYRYITLDRIAEPTQALLDSFNNIYGKDVKQTLVNVPLTCEGSPEQVVPPGPWITGSVNLTGSPVLKRNLELAIAFPQGLRRIRTKGESAGDLSPATTVFDIQWKYGTEEWQPLTELKLGVANYVDETYETYEQVGDNAPVPITATRKVLGPDSIKKDGFVWYNTYELPNLTGIVQVRIRRTTGDESSPEGSSYQYINSCSFQTIKIITNTSPAVDPPGCKIAKTALTIKATDQLNGNIEGINAIVQTYCLSWNGSIWAYGPTSNPADLFRYILTHPGNPRKVLESEVNSRIDLQQLQYWSTYCSANNFEYNSIEAGGRSIMEILRDICAAGRASPALIDGKWTVIIDEEKPTIVQHFTPHNSWGFESTKAIPQLPDAFRVNFIDEDQEYQQSETIIAFPGKDVDTAALFESIELPGVTKKSVVEDHIRWHIAQIKLRPEIYTLTTDIEYIVCNRGDRVKVTHDVPLWGLGSGRIKDIIVPQQVYDLDEQIYIENNQNYTIRVRSKTGQSTISSLEREFNIVYAQRLSGAIKVTLNEYHSVIKGDYINVNSTTSEISGENMLVIDVTDTTITYEKSVSYFAPNNYLGTVTFVNNNYTRIKLTTQNTTDLIDAGDLFLFGEANQESQDLIVLSIEPLDNKNARLTLMDYGVTDTYNIFTDYFSLSPNTVFETQMSLPPQGIRNLYKNDDKPRILQVYSGIEAAEILSPGTYSYNIRVTYLNKDDITLKTKYVECQYDFSSSLTNSSARTVRVPFAQGSVTISNIVQASEYKIRLRYIAENGAEGPWTLWWVHTTTGILDTTNQPLNILVDRITRYLEITPYIGTIEQNYIPQNFKTYEFRVYKNSGTGDFWDLIDSTIKTQFASSPIRFNLREFDKPRLSLEGIKYRIACRAVSTTDTYLSSSAISEVLITSLI